jgi:Spy/CpxP family protein refolding chaperone
MKKTLVILSCLFVLCGITYAEEMDGLQPNSESEKSDKHKCFKHRLTDSQREKMKTAYFKYKDSKIHLKENIDLARLNYQKKLADPNVTGDEVTSASEKIVESISKLMTAKFNYTKQIMFEILTEEQRKCKFHHRAMNRHYHHEKRMPEAADDSNFTFDLATSLDFPEEEEEAS